MMFLDTVH